MDRCHGSSSSYQRWKDSLYQVCCYGETKMTGETIAIDIIRVMVSIWEHNIAKLETDDASKHGGRLEDLWETTFCNGCTLNFLLRDIFCRSTIFRVDVPMSIIPNFVNVRIDALKSIQAFAIKTGELDSKSDLKMPCDTRFYSYFQCATRNLSNKWVHISNDPRSSRPK